MIQSNPLLLKNQSKWYLLLLLFVGLIALCQCHKAPDSPPLSAEAEEEAESTALGAKHEKDRVTIKNPPEKPRKKKVEKEGRYRKASESTLLNSLEKEASFSDWEDDQPDPGSYSLSSDDNVDGIYDDISGNEFHENLKIDLNGRDSERFIADEITSDTAYKSDITKKPEPEEIEEEEEEYEDADEEEPMPEVEISEYFSPVPDTQPVDPTSEFETELNGLPLQTEDKNKEMGTKGRDEGRISRGKSTPGLSERRLKSPKIIPGRPVITGSLDKKTIARVIRKHRNEIKYCYEQELKTNKNLEGKVVVNFTIDGTGAVKFSSTKKSSLNNPKVEACINAKIRQWRFPSPKGSGIVNVNYPFVFKPDENSTNSSEKQTTPSKPSPAAVFLQQRVQITGLTFKSPRGYWANTYLPGDSLVRTLQQRLTTNQNLSMGANTPSGLELATRSGTYKQPFDSPPRAALSAFMQADKKKVDKPSRVLLQVGIQGTSRKSGQRSAMNIGVVVDVRSNFSKAEKENFKALLEELSKSNEVGDRFSLFIAGRHGGMMIPPGSFKYGPVTVALQELFSGSKREKKVPQLTITDAYLMAIEKVTAADDPTAPLGSSLVILITPGTFNNLEGQLSRIAHRSAVNGIPTSVIGLSDRVDPDQLDRIAISGQGNRRLVITPSQAEEVIQAELSAASRVVARAVRLRIRLAPGVKLVDVLGSKSLDEASSQKVRDAEKSIDRRLSINLGIDSDRGEDEDGIQIVIPSFYADDSHVILLDLVVPGAGPVADLTVRYKDLVHLKNGISRANLSLQRGESKMGPLEQNVLKNLLAYELSRILKQSGRLTAGNNYREAHRKMSQFVELLKTLKQEIKGFSTDPELESDLKLVMNYLLALDSARQGNISRTKDLSDSLFYAGHLKLIEPR